MIKILLILFLFVSQGISALKFDGDDYIIINDETELDWIDYNVPFTVIFQVYPDNNESMGIFSKCSDGGGWSGGGFNCWVNGGNIGFRLVNSAVNDFWGGIAATQSGLVKTGQWNYVAIAYDGSGLSWGCSYYVNGAIEYETVENGDTASTCQNSWKMHLGTKYGLDTVNEPLKGRVSDIRLYQQKLTFAETESIRLGMISQCNTGNLVAQNIWKFDTNTYIQDYSGNGAISSGANIVGVSISTTTPEGFVTQ